VARPALAVSRIREQPIDDVFIGVRRWVFFRTPPSRRRGIQADQIEVNATEKDDLWKLRMMA